MGCATNGNKEEGKHMRKYQFIAMVFVVLAMAGKVQPLQASTSTPVYTIQDNGDMLFYQHAGFHDGSATWPIQAKKIGNGWNFKQVFAGPNGAVYAIQDNGDMLFYQHAGFHDGSATWPIQAKKIGNGWNFRQVFARND
jgi:uncharacterized protein (DUF779 family)